MEDTPFAIDIPTYYSMHQYAQSLYTQAQKGEISALYSHKNTVHKNNYQFNCYGFILHVIRAVNRATFISLVNAMHTLEDIVPLSYDGLPCPANLVVIFRAIKSPQWRVIKLSQATAGDLVIYTPTNYTLSPPKEKKLRRNGSHAMLIRSAHGETNNKYRFTVLEYTRRVKRKGEMRCSEVKLTPSTVQWKYRARKKDIVVVRLF